jgi:condensin complex subunit 1
MSVPNQRMYRYLFWTFRRTYDATLAELTSLEEMMRIMMEENHIHYDVIAKLWQVYSMFFLFFSLSASSCF